MEDPGQKAAPCLAPPVPRKLRTGQAPSFIGICLVLLLTLTAGLGFCPRCLHFASDPNEPCGHRSARPSCQSEFLFKSSL